MVALKVQQNGKYNQIKNTAGLQEGTDIEIGVFYAPGSSGFRPGSFRRKAMARMQNLTDGFLASSVAYHWRA